MPPCLPQKPLYPIILTLQGVTLARGVCIMQRAEPQKPRLRAQPPAGLGHTLPVQSLGLEHQESSFNFFVMVLLCALVFFV